MPYLSGRRVDDQVATITFEDDDDLSDAISVRGHAITGLIIPTIDSANLTFQVCDTRTGTYSTLKDKDGSTITITAGTGGFAVSTDDLTPLAAYRFIKIATSAAQTADREFLFILKV